MLMHPKIPIVILEEWMKISKTQARLREMGAPEHIIIPTKRMDPRIILRLTHRGTLAYEGQTSPKLIQILRRVGAERVFVGGRNTQEEKRIDRKIVAHEREWLPETRRSKDIISGGCAGSTYANLIHSGEFVRVRLIPKAVGPAKPVYPKVRRR